jgi:hypothetical protein
MPVQASGQLTLPGTFDFWFGNGNYGDFSSGPNSNVSLSAYYRGGTYVPNVTPNNSIPTSGGISFNNFRGATGRVSIGESTTLGSSGTLIGVKSSGSPQFGGGLGYLNSYRASAGQHLYWNSSTNILTYEVGNSSNDAVLTNDDLTFYSISTGGSSYPNEYFRSSATYTAATSTTSNKWTWSVGSSPFGGSGLVYLKTKFYS